MKKENYNRLQVFLLLKIIFLVLMFFSCVSLESQLNSQLDPYIRSRINDLMSPSPIADAITRSNTAMAALTPEDEYKIGQAEAEKILSTYKILETKPDAATYLNMICTTLVINSPELYNGYRVVMLDSDEINAFSSSDGQIFIMQGLIKRTTSEDTLAAVIAHEAAHIQLKHGILDYKMNLVLESFIELYSNPNATVTVENNTDTLSRDFNADAKAMSLMAQAGYEPSSLIDMLKLLEDGISSGFNSKALERITKAKTTAGNYHVPDTRSSRLARYKEFIYYINHDM